MLLRCKETCKSVASRVQQVFSANWRVWVLRLSNEVRSAGVASGQFQAISRCSATHTQRLALLREPLDSS